MKFVKDCVEQRIHQLREEIEGHKAEKKQLMDEVNRLTSETAALSRQSTFNDQKGGDHYKKMGDYQPWQVLAKWMSPVELKGFMKGTVIAYLAREEDKGGDLDIEKAHHTMSLYLELKANENNLETTK